MANYSPGNKITEKTFLGGGKSSDVTVYGLTLKGCRRLRELQEKNKRSKDPKTLGQIVNQLFSEKKTLEVKEVVSLKVLTQQKLDELRPRILKLLSVSRGYNGKDCIYQQSGITQEDREWISNTFRKYGIKPKEE